MIGDDYFNNLAMRSFFQDFHKDNNGNIISGKMHDLVHDFAQFLTKNECSVTQNNGTQLLNCSSRVRQLTFVCDREEVGRPRDSYDRFTSTIYKANKLRTLQILNGFKLNIKEVPADLFNHLWCLKVLCLKGIGLESLANEIENLIHLRYLDLSYNYKLKTLPEMISNLYNLQTLKLKGCHSLCELPTEMRRLINLRHLDISKTDELSHIPQGIGGLTSLRSLSDFIVGGASEGCKIGELKNLNLLQGDLSIRGLGRVETVNEAFEMKMKQKHLHSLILDFKPKEEKEQNLRHLDISGTHQLSHIPQGVGGLTSLRSLSDFIIGGASEGCKIGELKNLNLLQGDLSIRRLGRVETVNEAFEMKMKQKHLHSLMLDFKSKEEKEQNLENLMSKRMEEVLEVLEPHPDLVELRVADYLGFKLSRWIGSTSILFHMKILKLYDCINLTKFPAFGQLPSLEVLDIKRAMKVKHIGFEFYTNSLEHVNRVAFPKLKVLRMDEMNSLEVWELEHGVVMPCLTEIHLWSCPMLKALPALGKLPSLEDLTIRGAYELTHIGCEFLYEVDEAGGERFNNIAFPKLKTLIIRSIELEWEFEFMVAASTGEEIIIMPCLRELNIEGFKNLERSFVEILSKMPSLESLSIWGEATEFIKYIRHDDDDDLHTAGGEIIFPNLKELSHMEDMEELKIGFQVMPILKTLEISRCNKLKAIQRGLSMLDELVLDGCASLYELPPFPNLKRLELSAGPIHPSLPEAFANTLQALQVLVIYCWPTLTCMPEQVQQLTSLQNLQLYFCGEELKQRCRKDEGEDWRIISHIPNIKIY